ncbi:MAG TPA: carbamoyl phosphate synthase large subunit, partial [Candidatus Desulfofervidus auxilii]|nr:carbamoyl phosphate synthase large subunit [Candidatus Desulfofervidus auxilii]
VPIAKKLHQLGFKLAATRGTANYLKKAGLPVETVHKVREKRPDVVDHIKNHAFSLVINARFGQESSEVAPLIRKTALLCGVPYATTLAGARAMVDGIEALLKGKGSVKCLQEYHEL